MELLFNNYTVIILRLLHVVGGALWVGSGVLFFILLLPAIKSAESAGQVVMQRLGPRFHAYMGMIATITVVSGALLYSRLFISTGIQWIWSTAPGVAFTFGAIAGIVSFVIGGGIIGPNEKKIKELGAEMASAGRPSVDQVSRMKDLQAFMMKVHRFDFVMLMSALAAMAVARYL